MSKISVFMADGMEEVECLSIVDMARRAGIEVETVSIMGRAEVTSSHGVRIIADTTFEAADFESSDVLFLPGGIPGANNLAAHEGLCALVKRFAAEGRRVAAICAAPGILGGLGLLDIGGGFVAGLVTCLALCLLRRLRLPFWTTAIPVLLGPALIVAIWLSALLHIPYTAMALSLLAGQLLSAIVGAGLVRAMESRLHLQPSQS